MERTKFKIIVLLLFVFTASINGNYKSDIYKAFVSGDMDLWKNVIDRMSTTIYRIDMIPELVNYQYGYIGWCIGTKRYEEAKKYLEEAERNLEIMKREARYGSIVNSYLSAFYGYRIGMSPMLAPVLGPKSIDYANKALKLDVSDPFAYVQNGNIQFYRPAIFGGSKSEAIEYYLKALEIMETDTSRLEENWNYLSLLTVIAQAYSYLDDYDSSERYLKKILEIEPDFTWVKKELYPQILNKKNK